MNEHLGGQPLPFASIPQSTPNLGLIVGLMFTLITMMTHASRVRSEDFTLDRITDSIENDYPDVIQLSPSALEQSLRSKDRPLIVDVREKNEFRVSHIPGAIRMSPGSSAEAATKQLQTLAAGRPIVMYCSVGVRSTRMAARVSNAFVSRGLSAPANLRGGIFAWHARHGPLSNAKGATQAIHGYSQKWQKLIERSDAPIHLEK